MSNQLTAQQWGLCIGQKAMANDGVSGIVEGYRCGYVLIKYTEFNAGRFYKTSEIKPILRTLDQITEKEIREFAKEFNCHLSFPYTPRGFIFGILYEYPIQCIDWLTAKGFDIRGWIEQGLAIKQEANNG